MVGMSFVDRVTLRSMVARLKNNGKPIEYIDIDIPLNELTDGIHPK